MANFFENCWNCVKENKVVTCVVAGTLLVGGTVGYIVGKKRCKKAKEVKSEEKPAETKAEEKEGEDKK